MARRRSSALPLLNIARAIADDQVKDADKIPQSEAQYQQHPKGQRCEICLQFNPPNLCKIVRGEIDPKGWCQFFAARKTPVSAYSRRMYVVRTSTCAPSGRTLRVRMSR